MSRTRIALCGVTLVLYALIVLAVLMPTELVRLDWQLFLFRPYKQWPEVHALLDYFVVLGQRGPTAVLVMAWLGWRSWRQRTLRPLLVLGTSLLLLNASVGAVKYGLGRQGPHYATSIGSAELFAGGDIFPSGHTANAVVTWGILAYLATTPRARRWLSVVAAFFSLSIGVTTVYLGTHWLSDVVLGWAAGLLVLLALPWCEPAIARVEALIFALRARFRWSQQRRRGLVPAPAAPVGAQSQAHSGHAAPSAHGARGTAAASALQSAQQTASQMAQDEAAESGAGAPGARPSAASSATGGSSGGAAARHHAAGARQHPLHPDRGIRPVRQR